jgi:hypothetical protein
MANVLAREIIPVGFPESFVSGTFGNERSTRIIDRILETELSPMQHRFTCESVDLRDALVRNWRIRFPMGGGWELESGFVNSGEHASGERSSHGRLFSWISQAGSPRDASAIAPRTPASLPS